MEFPLIRSRRAVTASAFASMFVLGIAATLVGAAARNIGLSPTEIGLMLSLQNLGFLAGVTVSGMLADVSPKPALLATGSMLVAATFLTFYRHPSFGLNLALITGIGVGTAAYEGASDALLVELHPGRANRMVNVNHFFVTLGSLAITVYLAFLQDRWRTAMSQVSLLALLLLVVFVLESPRPGSHRVPTGRAGGALGGRLRLLLGRPPVLVLFLAAGLATGGELGSIGILTTYLMAHRGFTQVTSKIGLGVFLTSVALGRLLVGWLAREDRLRPLSAALFGASALTALGLYFLPWPPLTWALCALNGLALSSLIPLLIAQTGLLYPQSAGTAMGLIKIAMPAGGILVPLAFSALTGLAGLQAALLLFPLLAAAGALLLVAARRILP